MTAELTEKTERLVDFLQRRNLSGVLLNSRPNFAWLTGGGNNGIDLSRENGVATLMVTAEGRRYILANNIEMPRMLAEQVSESDFEPVVFSWQEEKGDPDVAVKIARSIAEGQFVSDLSLGHGVASADGELSRLRHLLTKDEVVRLREIGRRAAAAFDGLAAELRPGITETEAAAALRAKLGDQQLEAVVALVAADERIALFRHPAPTEKVWRKTLLLVACAKRSGLIVSLSRMMQVGSIPPDLLRKTEAVAKVNAALWSSTLPGRTGAELYKTAADAYEGAGYADEINNHHQGGAAGYRTREWVAHPGSTEIVQARQAFAWNPSIIGTKIEETVIAADGKIETITSSGIFPQIQVTVDGISHNFPGILSI